MISRSLFSVFVGLANFVTRLTAVPIVVDVVAVSVGVEAGYAARLGRASREHPGKKHQGVTQRHEADRAEVVLGLHDDGGRSLRAK